MVADLSLLLEDLSHAVDSPDARLAEQCVAEQHADWLTQTSDERIGEVLERLPAEGEWSEPQRAFLSAVAQCLAHRQRRREAAGLAPELTPADVERIAALYRAWGAEVSGRSGLLAWLAATGRPEALRMLAELLASDPPPDAPGVAQVLSPLLQRDDYDPRPLFPRLLDGLRYPHVGAPILDLCNFFTRRGQLAAHPARERAGDLTRLLSQLTAQLAGLDQVPSGESEALGRRQRQVFESLALVVALCDTLALIGQADAVETLREVLALRHRRVRTEAAAALAALGDPVGEAALIELAAEPVARLRVLAYAEELGFSERIAEAHQTSRARAEAELVLWLAQPAQFGLPPQQIEPFDERTQYWPGFEEPVECFLFRFTYLLADGDYHNVGIAGPLTHAFRVDLADLPPDDLYAAFAGWSAEHDDIYHQDATLLLDGQQAEVARLERRLRDAGYQEIRPRLLGYFLGDRVLVADALRQGQKGTAVVDADQLDWRPRALVARPLDAETEYCIYKGRRMLRTFNG